MPRTLANPPNRFHQTHTEYAGEGIEEPPPVAGLEVIEDRSARSILAENDSPDVGFRWSVNPYRGCYHGCAYCYARPSHAYLGYGAGTDFERKIVVKLDAPELLREAFAKKSWTGELVALSGNTDCYQPLEAKYLLTRRILEVCVEHRNPAGVITKNALVARDADVLSTLAKVAHARVTISAAFRDDATARAIEPWASPITKRFEAMRRLAEAGIEVGLSLAPVIPGLTDDAIPELLERAKEAGASYAFIVLLRLPREVLPIFTERVTEALPLRAEKILHAVREMRGGAMNESGFGARMVGVGERWKTIEKLFEVHARRLGLNQDVPLEDRPPTFRRPKRQLALFDD